MEGLTDQLSQFSLGEVQRAGVASSFVLLFRKMLSLALDSETINGLLLGRPSSEGNEFTQHRKPKSVKDFSNEGLCCRDRLRAQLSLRFPSEDINEIKAMLLDPRIKSKANSIISDPVLVTRAEQELQAEHCLYHDVDILKWFKDHGENSFPAISILARIYLAKPMSTAQQERVFSLSGYVVNELRTRLDEDRAEKLCLMKANWPQYKLLMNE
ncbi:hypothetical protein PHMEG_0003931 [Phytophthora megakarya]|uniref:HAT C-terminal dimerisation domain-containing protein n=1 Tax=Phytophthora megakarya TaxID=4795 RepID=A0A225WV55_9STRA|nr:hypothetical protein PHMEG_0003931 [Phytophthora megakarya]